MLECIELVPLSLMLAGWWRVVHQSTEYFIIGIFMAPNIEIYDEALIARISFFIILKLKINANQIRPLS